VPQRVQQPGEVLQIAGGLQPGYSAGAGCERQHFETRVSEGSKDHEGVDDAGVRINEYLLGQEGRPENAEVPDDGEARMLSGENGGTR
jgi:hypothetical protein